MNNSALNKAMQTKNDEFYTMYEDIEKEVTYYPLDTWKDKIIYCNCDDYKVSNFTLFFKSNFKKLRIRELHTTGYSNEEAYHEIYKRDGGDVTIETLKGNGSFNSDECIDILKQCDIVVTNPPFSLFREYIDLLMKYGVDFLVLGNQNAITYKNIFPHIKDEKIYLGFNNGVKDFIEPSGSIKKFGNICWYTTIAHDNPNKIVPHAKWFDSTYEKYDNYDAINVDRIKNIPWDYDSVMGVPITYLYKHNPSIFEIVGCTESEGKGFSNGLLDTNSKCVHPLISGKKKYKRIFIKRKKK